VADLWYDVFESSWGWMAVAGSPRGIRYTSLPEESPERAVDFLDGVMKGELPEHRPGAFQPFQRQIEEYFSGEREQWDVELDLDGSTEFFRKAWEACSSIPSGETRTYRWLAEQAGRPLASRGAGQAMARNRVPIVIPCHRVVGSDGGLHGFAGPGLPLKARLLQHEAERASRKAGMPRAV
jgi:methylated-DNA-[protein]-cysteine S-methyltransferase